MSNIFSSTDARKSFFEILNKVLYGNEDIYITKAGTKFMVKLEKVEPSRVMLSDLAGSISENDAEIMKEAVRESRIRKPRKVKDF